MTIRSRLRGRTRPSFAGCRLAVGATSARQVARARLGAVALPGNSGGNLMDAGRAPGTCTAQALKRTVKHAGTCTAALNRRQTRASRHPAAEQHQPTWCAWQRPTSACIAALPAMQASMVSDPEGLTPAQARPSHVQPDPQRSQVAEP